MGRCFPLSTGVWGEPDISECLLVPFTTPHQFLTSAPHSPSLCPGPSPTSVSLVLVQPAFPGLAPCINHNDVCLLWASTTQSDSLETQCPRGVLPCRYQESNNSWAQRLGQGCFLNVQVTESAYRMSGTMLGPFTELRLWNIHSTGYMSAWHTQYLVEWTGNVALWVPVPRPTFFAAQYWKWFRRNTGSPNKRTLRRIQIKGQKCSAQTRTFPYHLQIGSLVPPNGLLQKWALVVFHYFPLIFPWFHPWVADTCEDFPRELVNISEWSFSFFIKKKKKIRLRLHLLIIVIFNFPCFP